MRMGKERVISREGDGDSERLQGKEAKSKSKLLLSIGMALVFIHQMFALCGSVSQTFMNHTDKIFWFTNL